MERRFTAAAVLVLAFCGVPSSSEPVETVIVGPDRAPTLLLPAEASEQVRTAAADLQRCLEAMTGQRPRLAVEPEKAAPPILAVGPGELVKKYVSPDELKALGPEEVILRTFADGVVLTGRTDLATQHAVYVFLERLGCRWFFPGDAWEEIPERETIALEALDVREEPSFRARSIWYGWGTIRKCALDYRKWVRRNRMGGWLTGSVGHAYANIANPDRDFEEHPEYFPLIDGKRVARGQLCLSNPDVQQRAIERARNAFGKNPAQLMISMSPNDGGGYCDCDQCAAMGSRSDQTLKLCNVVAEAIADQFPDRYLGMYAYYANCAPPSVEGHPNVMIYVATAFIRGGYTVDQLLDGWSKKVKNIGIRDYYNVIIWNRDRPRWRVDLMRERIPFYNSKNVTAISAESSNNWAPEGLNYYVASKLMWNAKADVDVLLEDFYRTCWHAAAPAMRRYYGRLERKVPVNERTLALWRRDLAEAAKLVDDDPAALRRVDLFRLYLHWLRLYRAHIRTRTSEEQARTAREAFHFAWRLAETSMVHSHGQFRETRMWRLPRDLPRSELVRWKTSGEPPEEVEPPAVEITLSTETDDDPAVSEADGFTVTDDLDPGDKAGEPVRKKAKPFFTHAEVEAICQTDRAALPRPVEVDEGKFSRELVPIVSTDIELPKTVAASRPIYGGRNTFVLHAAEAGKCGLEIETGIGTLGVTRYSVLPFPRRGRFARDEVKGRDTYPVQFELPEKGLYRLQIDSIGTGSRLGFGTMPCSLVAPVANSARLAGGPERLHFFVSSGTATFAVGVISPTGQGKVTVRDAEGKMVAQETVGCPQGCEFAVRVPPGADGKVWSLSVDKCDDEVGLYLIAVPPYLSQRPEQLLIPQETAKSRETRAP